MTSEEVFTGLRQRRHAVVDAWLVRAVPAHGPHRDWYSDVREAGERIITCIVDALAERRQIRPDDLDFARGYLRRALLRGATEVELVRTSRLWQPVVWDELERLAGPGNADLVAELSRRLIDHVEALSDAVADAVHEIHTALRLTGREGRRELLEGLLAGRPTAPDATGIAESAAFTVVAARPRTGVADQAALSVAAVQLSHAPGDAVEPLFAVRENEVVLVRATPDAAAFVEVLDAARKRLAAESIDLVIGISALHSGPAEIPGAYEEALLAQGRAGRRGLLALATVTPLDYLFLRGGDDTAWALVDPAVRTFVENDLAQAGLLVSTLMAFVDASMNVKLAAESLFVHPNTAHYRLTKIEEATGRDLRVLDDLMELVIAVRLAHHRAARA